MKPIMIAGIGTDVGKTVVSAIVATALGADYWKPLECGESDSNTMAKLLDPQFHTVHPSSYTFKALVSPHHAALLEDTSIDCHKIRLPRTHRLLVIEGVGGLLVPLTVDCHTLDLFQTWDCHWVIVSSHYLGSINHTLLTIEMLKSRSIPISGIIFNGEPNRHTEEAILTIGQIPCLGRLLPQITIDKQTIQRIAALWKPQWQKL
jgi:dethiobiotin synthetase